MADQDDQRDQQWPDFLPPDFAETIDQAPREATPQLPPPIPINRPRVSRPARRPDPDRWFNQPAPGGALPRRSVLPAPDGPTTVTFALMAICLVVWVLQSLFAPVNAEVMLIPALGASEPWRFVTSAFAHLPRSLSHIGFNMLTLWLMGRYLEPILGHRKFLAVYLIAALGGGAAFVLLAVPGQVSWQSGVVGASGAIFGLFGAYLVLAWALKRPLTAIWVLLGLNVVTAVIFPGIAWQGHLGGFLAGAAATAILLGDLRRRGRDQRSLTVPGLLVLTALIVASLVVKYATSL